MSSMFEPHCPNCGAENFRGGRCAACGFGTFPPIQPVEISGVVKLELVEVYPDERMPMYRAFNAKLTIIANGEVREQTVAGLRFARGWRETAERRMSSTDPDLLTPQTIVSMKWDN